jgi:hypothetical protein
MAKFFKSPNRQDPTHSLPTVQYRDGKCYFEFTKGASGFLEYETDDPKKIAELKKMGYRPKDAGPPEPAGDQPPMQG